MNIKKATINYTRTTRGVKNELNAIYGVSPDIVLDEIKAEVEAEIMPDEDYKEVIAKIYGELKQRMDEMVK